MTENPAVQEEVKTAPQVTEKPQEVQQENVEDINWRKFRQQREEERKQREQAERYAKQKEEEANALKQAMAALVDKPTPQSNEEEETEDKRIERMVEEKIKQKEAEYERKRIEKENEELPNKLSQVHRDFNDVCTTENLDYLEYHYPEIAQAYKFMPDGFQKWDGIYKALKRFIPNKEAKKDMNKADKNLNKPLAISRPGATQTGDHAPILQLDEARKKANWERMQKNMGKGGVG